MTQEDTGRTNIERTVADWTDLARKSLSEAARWARAYANAGATYWAETGKVVGEFAGDVNDAARTASQAFNQAIKKTVAAADAPPSQEAQTSKSPLAEAVSQVGSAWVRVVTRYGEVYQRAVETFVADVSSREGAPESVEMASAAEMTPNVEAAAATKPSRKSRPRKG